MGPIFVLLVGVTIVIGGVLALRLHPFLALLAAAIVVGLLTPEGWRMGYFLRQQGVPVRLGAPVGNDGRRMSFTTAADQSPALPGHGMLLVAADHSQRAAADHSQRAAADPLPADGEGADGEGADGDGDDGGRDGRVIIGDRVAVPVQWNAGPDDQPVLLAESDSAADWFRRLSGTSAQLIPMDQWQGVPALARQDVGTRVAVAFGRTAASIGIVIALAAVIGVCLLESGAAESIVLAMLRVTGERRAPAALMAAAFILGIPVFFDTVFYLMIPLAIALWRRTRRNYLWYVLCVYAGASIAHSIVPPTPGPLYVADALGVDMGLMILAGLATGTAAAVGALTYAWWIGAGDRLTPARAASEVDSPATDRPSDRPDRPQPAVVLAALPIVLPVALIAGLTIAEKFPRLEGTAALDVLRVVGEKHIALGLATVIGLLMLFSGRREGHAVLRDKLGAAIASGGVILLITAAGGAFGAMIRQTGIAALIAQLPTGSPMLLLIMAFLITAAVRTAQGSSTVSMITSVGILSGLASAETLGFHPVYLALAIGFGSKPIGWMNDSGFWVTCRLGGLTEAEGLKWVAPMDAVVGLGGLAATLLGAWLLPLTS